MTNSITHLLYGYSISKNLSKDMSLIIYGLIMSILLDIDYLPIPGLTHHGFIHTPVFVIVLSLLILIITRSKIIFTISFSNLFFHLILDTIGTRDPIMWFYPLSDTGFALGTHVSLIVFIIIKIILFSIPFFYILYCYLERFNTS